MIVFISIWRGAEKVLTGTASDGELVSELKQLAQAKGYRVEIRETGVHQAERQGE